MFSLPPPLAALVAELRHLPGIGPRSAERLALHLVQADESTVRRLSESLLLAKERIRACSVCGAMTEADPCPLCSDPRRDGSIVCLVERATDILSLEKSRTFRGRYHVLGGKISPLNGIGPEDLKIAALERRLTSEPIQEIIIALGTDVEGDATGFYLAKRLARAGLRVSRIAHGLPAGSGLEFADEVTLSRALEDRRAL
jgi:recombination protein RecR